MTLTMVSSRKKPKTNRKGDIYEPKGYDLCQTPPEAVVPLIKYLRPFKHIWEPARGKGYLVEAMNIAMPTSWVFGSDIADGCNFFEYEPSTGISKANGFPNS